MIKATYRVNMNPNAKTDAMNMALNNPEVLQALIKAAEINIARRNNLLPRTKEEEEERKQEDIQKLTAVKSELLQKLTRSES